MTDLADPVPTARVLEVGTGSGYQAAVLAECVAQRLHDRDRRAARRAGAQRCSPSSAIATSTCAIGDGYRGWPEAAPFDAIVVTAAPDHVPQPLVDQLAPGGRMVIPVGQRDGVQDLLVITKDADGRAVTPHAGGALRAADAGA